MNRRAFLKAAVAVTALALPLLPKQEAKKPRVEAAIVNPDWPTGTLYNYRIFSAINCTGADSIKFTYTVMA